MLKITNWTRENRTPTLAYRNANTDARASDTYRYTWRAAILVDGHPVWIRGFDTKATVTLRKARRSGRRQRYTVPTVATETSSWARRRPTCTRSSDGSTVGRAGRKHRRGSFTVWRFSEIGRHDIFV